MTEVFKSICSHTSIRSFKADPITDEMMEQILVAASRASSSGNMQVYSIIVTSDKELKKQLSPAHFNQEAFSQAPYFLTFCADFHRMRRWMKLRNAADNFDNFMSFMIACLDATLAAQNAVLAAEAQGLGICFLGTTLASCQRISKILECPESVVPVAGFALGYPNESPTLRDRLPLKGLVHKQKYQSYSDEDILRIYKDRETSGWNRYMSDPQLRSRVEKSGVENLAQIYTQVKYTKESHEEYSNSVINCLREQGFMGIN